MPDLGRSETSKSSEREAVEEATRLAKHVMTMLNAMRVPDGHQQKRLDRMREFQSKAIDALDDALYLLIKEGH
jgi:hypothetical protein